MLGRIKILYKNKRSYSTNKNIRRLSRKNFTINKYNSSLNVETSELYFTLER